MTDTPPQTSELSRRIVVGLALIAIALAALYGGGIPMWVLISVASLLMMAEWADLMKVDARQKRLAMFSLSVPLAILSPLAAGPDFFALGLIAGAAFFVTIVTRLPRLGWGLIYVGIPALALLFLRELPNGLLVAFWALAIVWATDIGAYFAGRSIGGPKLMPRVSPSKTWAGLIGGMVAALVCGLIFYSQAGLPVELALTSPILAVIAQIGDLYESGLKREAGVKDSGNILPGHGGVLDRLDGVVTVAPSVALLIFAGKLG